MTRIRVEGHAYDLVGEVVGGGIEASTAAYEAAFTARRGHL